MILDFQSGQSVDAYRRRWVRRRIPVSPELAAFLAAMAFEEGAR